MRGKTISAPWVFVTLLGIAASGIGILVWLTPVNVESMTPAQDNLLTIADWMVKAALGAILGFAGGVGLAARNGHS